MSGRINDHTGNGNGADYPEVNHSAKRSSTEMRIQVQKGMTMRSNDFGGMLEQAIRESAGPAIIGFIVAISRTIYKDGRKKWRVTIAEATMIAMATGTVGPLLAYFGLPQDMAYPAAVFMGYIGIDRMSIAVCRRLGIE